MADRTPRKIRLRGDRRCVSHSPAIASPAIALDATFASIRRGRSRFAEIRT
ncbi:hypothetical protein BURPS1106B_2316 [Burkholderia pseudomallei 1106b]|uniref:Uncharacterized protein n=1 Tax=Burkholderia pseudomallei (strain 1106a) TaxID=357348 RepID=A3P978_BURP0|nr:hypothetical protein BURPS1106A_A2859 [Burkholderia pseudomallei 1106a]EEC34811.1 conserved hypothetical protein [Burkholderia pseudomallei 576]EES21404.1 hypothetical protein BURPS1106B_2316 [Burkholderia pseudomallei 1106b]